MSATARGNVVSLPEGYGPDVPDFIDALRDMLGLGPLSGDAVSASYDRKPEKRAAMARVAYRGGPKKKHEG